jgi:CspA family cold shock protein
MASGTIASLRDKGFGFILPDGASGRGDLFFHQSAVTETSFDYLREGQRVSFDEAPDPRDPSRQRAINVRLVGDGAEDDPS